MRRIKWHNLYNTIYDTLNKRQVKELTLALAVLKDGMDTLFELDELSDIYNFKDMKELKNLLKGSKEHQ